VTTDLRPSVPVLLPLKVGDEVSYQGSIRALRGVTVRVVATHRAYGEEHGDTRYAIDVLNGRGDVVQTLWNARRTSLRAPHDPK
jgi:hypothetical protein